MKITIAQMNPTVGDIDGNSTKIKNTLNDCIEDSTDLLVFSELFLTGYPPRDLLERPWFITKVEKAVQKITEISKQYPKTGILFGAPVPTGKNSGHGLYNSALLIHGGEIIFKQHKSLLPTYDVFDEARYFDPAPVIDTVPFKNEVLGISICEDAWNDPELWIKRNYSFDPIEELHKREATVFINLSASPFHIGKEKIRFRILQSHATKHQTPFVFINQVGGNDELIFDGRSMFVDRKGTPVEIFPSFKEHVKTIDTGMPGSSGQYCPQDETESVYEALILGIRDYMQKCNFKRAVVGLSGGIDSAVTCCLAKEAVGSENILGVSMPSPYSSGESLEYAKKLAENLGIELKVIPISQIYHSYVETLGESLQLDEDIDITLENIQARIRGNTLMAISNKYNYLVLSTGNKSELAVGYCTLYGDMSGGLAAISDVPKTMVYELAGYINGQSEIIPREIIIRPPSAELKPDQKDQDTLPAYDVLDEILQYYIDEKYSMKKILDMGFDKKTVDWVIRAVDRNEYKRKQAAPGLKVTTKAFGMGRRMPIAAKHEI